MSIYHEMMVIVHHNIVISWQYGEVILTPSKLSIINAPKNALLKLSVASQFPVRDVTNLSSENNLPTF